MRMYVIFVILFSNYEKPYMYTIIGSSGRDCVLIILLISTLSPLHMHENVSLTLTNVLTNLRKKLTKLI